MEHTNKGRVQGRNGQSKERLEEKGRNKLSIPRIGDSYKRIKLMDCRMEDKDVMRVMNDCEGQEWESGWENGLKPELYKEVRSSRVVVEAMQRGYEAVLENINEPGSWKELRTDDGDGREEEKTNCSGHDANSNAGSLV